MTNLPLITCIIPIFNHELYVENALNSLVTQNYPNLRIICVDDASTDNSFEKTKSLCKNLRKLPVNNESEPGELLVGQFNIFQIVLAKFKENHGPSAARNYGLNSSKDSDLIAFLDADDWYEPNKLHLSIQPFLKYPNLVGIVYSDYTTVNKITGLRCREFKPPYSRDLLLKECIINCDSVVSMPFLLQTGFFDESIRSVEDFDTWLRLTEKSIAVHIPESLVNIRVGGNSSTNTLSKQQWETNYRYVFEKLRARNT